jgi:hypothetical protein
VPSSLKNPASVVNGVPPEVDVVSSSQLPVIETNEPDVDEELFDEPELPQPARPEIMSSAAKGLATHVNACRRENLMLIIMLFTERQIDVQVFSTFF